MPGFRFLHWGWQSWQVLTFKLAVSWVSTFRLVILTSFDIHTGSKVLTFMATVLKVLAFRLTVPQSFDIQADSLKSFGIHADSVKRFWHLGWQSWKVLTSRLTVPKGLTFTLTVLTGFWHSGRQSWQVSHSFHWCLQAYARIVFYCRPQLFLSVSLPFQHHLC